MPVRDMYYVDERVSSRCPAAFVARGVSQSGRFPFYQRLRQRANPFAPDIGIPLIEGVLMNARGPGGGARPEASARPIPSYERGPAQTAAV